MKPLPIGTASVIFLLLLLLLLLEPGLGEAAARPDVAPGCEADSPSGTFRAIVPPGGGVVRVVPGPNGRVGVGFEVDIGDACPAHVLVDDEGRYVLAVEAVERSGAEHSLWLVDCVARSVRAYGVTDLFGPLERRRVRDAPGGGRVWHDGGHFLEPRATTFFLVTFAGLKTLEGPTGAVRDATGAEAARSLEVEPLAMRARLAAIRRAAADGHAADVAGEIDPLLERLAVRPYEEPAHADVFRTFVDVFGGDERLRAPARLRRLLDVYLAYDRWDVRLLFDDRLDPAAVPFLVATLRDARERGPVRVAAASCLLGMGDREDEAFAFALARLDDLDEGTREEAQHAIWYAPRVVSSNRGALERRFIECLSGERGDRARALLEKALAHPRVRSFGEDVVTKNLGKPTTSARAREGLLRAVAAPRDGADDAEALAKAVLPQLGAAEPAVAAAALDAFREVARLLALEDDEVPPILKDADEARAWWREREQR